MPILAPTAQERVGYPTQKPLALLERIVQASSNEGDMVLDPFLCGCATTCVAAETLERRWIGIDIGEKPADIVKERLAKLNPAGGDDVIRRTDIPERTDLPRLRDKDAIRADLYAERKGRCFACDKKGKLVNMRLAHIIPQERGGLDVEENLRLLCGDCDEIKNAGPMAALIRKLKKMRQTAVPPVRASC